MDSDPILSKRYQALFDEFNARYFHGRLPPYRIRVVEHIPGRQGPAGLHQRTHTRILIRRSDDDDMIVTLLHEMAHAATVDNHNNRWRTEMQRLRQAGAPIPDGELRTPTRMTKQFIENEATELLSDGRLNWTLRQFVRDLVSQGEVVAHSQAALLRQYPWVARVFSETKKRTRKEQEAREALRERFRAGKEA